MFGKSISTTLAFVLLVVSGTNAQSLNSASTPKNSIATIAKSNGNTTTLHLDEEQKPTHLMVEAPSFGLKEGISDIEVTFEYRRPAKTNMVFEISDAGVIRAFSIDGVERTLNDRNYPYEDSLTERLWLENGVAVPNEGDWWHKAHIAISGATHHSVMRWQTPHYATNELKKFGLRNIEIKVTEHLDRKEFLRVMDYNIQNAMWADQGNNYDNFVEWMRRADTDVVIFCEAQSNYITGIDKRMPEPIMERYLPAKWGEFAARWGHKYWVIGAHQDNHPVVVTSRYPLTLIQALGGEEVSHGGVHAQVEVNGEKIDLVGFHTFPHAYARELVKTDRVKEQKESRRRYDGEKMRTEEIKIFMERTILNKKFRKQKNWLIMGDTNCLSPLDDRFFGHGIGSPLYWGHQYILDNTTCTDIVKAYCCPQQRDVLIPSIQWERRIDIIYASPSMMERVVKVETPKDEFTTSIKEPGLRHHKRSSDHLPVIVDFKIANTK